MKKDDEKEISKKFGKDDIEKIANKELKFKIKIKEVKSEIIPELDDELAKKIDKDVKNVAELKTKVKERLEDFAVNTTKNKAFEKIVDKIIEQFEGDIPQSMIDYQQNAFYNQLVSQVGGDEKRVESFLKMQNMDKEAYKEKMKDDAVRLIKKSLILKKIIKEEKLEATEDEMKAYLEKMAKQYNLKSDDMFESYKKGGQLEYLENEVVSQKAVDYLCDKTKVSKNKKISLKDLEKQQQKENK